MSDDMHQRVEFEPEDRPSLDAEPCNAISIGTMSDGKPSIVMMVGKTDRYYYSTTPESMREFAAELVNLADEAEQEAKP